ncbi:DNA-binding protein [Tsukamurella ocularis]|uniref:DNA-binding protein n=1 Tax=Tsukamurella ocularis TaxID=1970234 RepID=UPI0039F02074
MSEMSVSAAAQHLKVTPRQVARLARSGELTVTRRVGGALLLDGASVHRRAHARPARGRPATPAGAWAALAMLSGETADWLDPAALSRLRARLRRSCAEDVAWTVRRRSLRIERMQGWGDATGLIPTGASVLTDPYWSDYFELSAVDRGTHDGYVPQKKYAATIRDLGLIEDPEGDFTIRVVPASAGWPVDRVLPAAVAVDLMESLDTREAAAGNLALTRMLGRVS